MQIHELTALARNSKASDIHISEGLPLMFRIDGHLAEAPVQLSAAETRSLILSLMDEAHREAITSERIDADFALVAPDGTRSRVNVFYQQGRAAATLRLLNDSIPTLEGRPRRHHQRHPLQGWQCHRRRLWPRYARGLEQG